MDLRVERVSFEYPGGLRALDAIDLDIAGGSAVALIGANGSGKTTLARHLDGLLRPLQGRVVIDGEDAAERHVAELAAKVGVCFPDPARQFFTGRCWDEVAFGARQLGTGEPETRERVLRALDEIGLADAFERNPNDLGDAQRKLLSVASVLAMQTPIVVLDEPTVGLDAPGRQLIRSWLAALDGQGRTVIVISHDMAFVAETCRRIVMLSAGRVTFDGSVGEAFAGSNAQILGDAGLQAPAAARIGAKLGLGSTPTEAALLRAVREAAERSSSSG